MAEKKDTKRLLGYIRVSTDGQSENFSFEEQERKIQEYCRFKGYQVDIVRETGSGKNIDERPVFKGALDDLKNYEGIIAYKLDRIARNTSDVLRLVDDYLKPQHKSLILLDLEVDTSTPTGMMILTVMAAVAQLERDVIRERTFSGRKVKHSKGGYAFGAPPFGYCSIDGELREIEEEQKVIRRIRELYGTSGNFSAVARQLNQDGFKTRGIKDKRGERQGQEWTATQIKRILERLEKMTHV